MAQTKCEGTFVERDGSPIGRSADVVPRPRPWDGLKSVEESAFRRVLVW